MKKAAIALLALAMATTLVAKDKRPGPGGPGGAPLEMMDTDEDGKVTQEEWNTFQNKMFAKLDLNSNGEVTEKEAKKAHEQMHEEMREKMKDCMESSKKD